MKRSWKVAVRYVCAFEVVVGASPKCSCSAPQKRAALVELVREQEVAMAALARHGEELTGTAAVKTHTHARKCAHTRTDAYNDTGTHTLYRSLCPRSLPPLSLSLSLSLSQKHAHTLNF